MAGDPLTDIIAQNVTAIIRRNAQIMTRDAFGDIARAVAKGTVGVTRGAQAFAVGYNEGFANPSDVNAEYMKIAAKMRTAVRTSYSAKVKGGGAGQYRIGGGGNTTKGGFLARYSGGSLKRAVFNENLVQVAGGRINFVDQGRLTREAAHWARMNFGTAPNQRKRTFYRIQVDSRVVGPPVGFSQTSRPGFMLPAGTWRNAAGQFVPASRAQVGQHQFWPLAKGDKGTRNVEYDRERKTRDGSRFLERASKPVSRGLHRKHTQGIKPHEFLDAGLRAYATNVPRSVKFLLDKWFKDAEKRRVLPAGIRHVSGDPLPLSYTR